MSNIKVEASPESLRRLAELRAAVAAKQATTPSAWLQFARPDQLPPPGDWLVWAMIAGSGAGKTRAMAEWVIDQIRCGNRRRVALISRTPADVRDVMVEGDSGLLTCAPPNFRPAWNPSIRRLTWPNGAICTTYSSENPEQLRGPQHDLAWADEPAAWDDARRGDVVGTAWNNMMLGLRLGDHPQCGFSTTPKNVKLVRQVLSKPFTVVTRASTYDNLENLAPSFRDQVLAAYEGTRIGRQELLGELLTDVEGALVTIDMIDAQRLMEMPAVHLTRVVVAVDPATTSGEDSDETGIVVCAKGVDGRGYVLHDASMRQASPDTWARRVAAVYEQFSALTVSLPRNRVPATWSKPSFVRFIQTSHIRVLVLESASDCGPSLLRRCMNRAGSVTLGRFRNSRISFARG